MERSLDTEEAEDSQRILHQRMRRSHCPGRAVANDFDLKAKPIVLNRRDKVTHLLFKFCKCGAGLRPQIKPHACFRCDRVNRAAATYHANIVGRAWVGWRLQSTDTRTQFDQAMNCARSPKMQPAMTATRIGADLQATYCDAAVVDAAVGQTFQVDHTAYTVA